MPLEFRLCNSILLISTEDAQNTERYAGYLSCQKKVDAAMYQAVFLKGATLPPADNASVVAANKPKLGDRSFPGIVLSIARGLAMEAIELAVSGLSSLASDYETASGDDPR
jgi:hypothetical protein